jgi:putative nucleotidyltransferase with HDIG domain
MVTRVDEARALAEDKLASMLPRRWAHVQGVARQAAVAVELFREDGELLVVAALLHDVGYAPGLVDTGFHPVDGARYLRGVGASDRLTNLVAHHSCAVLEAEERGLSAALAEFEDEGPTALRDALWWADMTTTPDGEPTTVEQRVREIQERYGPDDVVSCFIRWAWPELKAAVDRTEARLREAGIG